MKCVPVKGFEEEYTVCEDGRVKSNTRYVAGRIKGTKRRVLSRTLRQKTNRRGYKEVTLCKQGKKYSKSVHSIVAESFLGKRPNKHHVAHIDGNPTNNNLKNLAFVTPKENEAHKILHGRSPTGKRNGKYTKPERTPRGENHGQAKFTNKEVEEIRKSKLSSYRLAKELGVSKTCILNIKRKKTYVLQ